MSDRILLGGTDGHRGQATLDPGPGGYEWCNGEQFNLVANLPSGYTPDQGMDWFAGSIPLDDTNYGTATSPYHTWGINYVRVTVPGGVYGTQQVGARMNIAGCQVPNYTTMTKRIGTLSNADFSFVGPNTYCPNTVVDFVGEVHPEFIGFVMRSEILSGMTTFTPPVPHKELVALYGTSSVMLLILTGYKDAEGYMPGKLFEYLATGLPVIGTGPEQGDAADLLNGTGAGVMIDGSRDEVIQSTLLNHFQRWQQHPDTKQKSAGAGFSRSGVTRQLAELLRK